MDVLEEFYNAERVYTTLPSSTSAKDKQTARDKWLSFVDEKVFALHQSPDLPWGGEYKGRKGFIKWMDIVDKYVSKIDVESHDILANEDGSTVIVWMTVHWTARRSGRDISLPMTQVWDVDPEKHALVGLRPFYWDVKGFKEFLEAET